MQKVEIPTSPLLLSMILGPIAETNFRRALVISNGDYSVFFTSPISVCILLVSLGVVLKTARDEILTRRTMRRLHGK